MTPRNAALRAARRAKGARDALAARERLLGMFRAAMAKAPLDTMERAAWAARVAEMEARVGQARLVVASAAA